MNEIIKNIEAAQLKESVPSFNVGDTVKVYNKGKVRRAKLNYLRDRVGKAAKVKELVK